jgi:tetratricopeptide (TPR) repeat protein
MATVVREVALMATIPDALNLAIQHHQGGRLQEAEVLYRQVLQEHPNHPDALHLLGLVAHQVGRHVDAADLIGKAIVLNPTVAEYHNDIGEAYRALGRLEDAQAGYQRALALNSGFADAFYNLGLLHSQQGRLDEAAACYRRALEIKPDNAAVHNNLGNVLKGLGKMEEAAAHYRQALALKPNLAEAYNNLGAVLQEQSRVEEAVAHYRQALALRPAYVEAIINLRKALNQQGGPEDPIQAILSPVLPGPKDPIFDRHVLSIHEHLYVRGMPRRYLECACRLLRYLAERSNRPVRDLVIIEIGTMSSPMLHRIEEHNPRCCVFGHSTVFWARTGATVHTVDVNPSCQTALASLCREYPNLVVHTGDGCRFLKEFGQPIDLLYLDAWDVQPGVPYAERHAEAYEAARPRLAASCIVSIDDTDMGSGGKGRLVFPMLVRDGFEFVAYGRQTIAVRLSPP